MNAMKRKGAMLLMASGGDTYRRVKSINTSGEQYIDTGYYLKNNSSVKMHFRLSEVVSGVDIAEFGARTVFSDTAYNLFYPVNTHHIHFAYGNQDKPTYWVYPTVGDYYFESNKNDWKFYKDDSLLHSYIFSEETFTTQYSAYIGRLNHSGHPVSAGILDIQETVMYDDDNIGRNFIPVVRESDNKPGLLDLNGSICPLTGTSFYVNANICDLSPSEFGWTELDGTRVSPKAGFSRVKYLESNNKQYIDTGLKSSDKPTKVIIDYSITSIVGQGFVFGEWNNSGTNMLIGYEQSEQHRFQVSCGDNSDSASIWIVNPADTNEHTAGWENGAIVFDGVDTGKVPGLSVNFGNYPLYLFSRNGYREYTDNYFKVRQAVIGHSDAEKTRNFVSALNGYNKPCMYDTIHDVAYYNQGSGEFGYEKFDGSYVAPT